VAAEGPHRRGFSTKGCVTITRRRTSGSSTEDGVFSRSPDTAPGAVSPKKSGEGGGWGGGGWVGGWGRCVRGGGRGGGRGLPGGGDGRVGGVGGRGGGGGGGGGVGVVKWWGGLVCAGRGVGGGAEGSGREWMGHQRSVVEEALQPDAISDQADSVFSPVDQRIRTTHNGTTRRLHTPGRKPSGGSPFAKLPRPGT